ncbi:hypothetical protein HELRODRAFT_162521 [Helobdella robusta]|uniref:Tetraspanin n=1 Tax=Helobdella robusta TaxID=6412 RepID=T1ESS5_HELRO|nr:hypothetical protein HELRODRAFT_162521 [Helobdella robusta]ESN99043.1 hypothetical protein HELRODRAFT_162521 [Helobdella robusta]
MLFALGIFVLLLGIAGLYGAISNKITVLNILGCCGANDSEDYRRVEWNSTFTLKNQMINATVPPSCCKNETLGLPQALMSRTFYENLDDCLSGDVSKINLDGCVVELKRSFQTVSTTLVIIGTVLLLIQGAALWTSNTLMLTTEDSESSSDD